jgi:hypothetical protein
VKLAKKIPKNEMGTLKKEWVLAGNDYSEFPPNELNLHTENTNNWYILVDGHWELEAIEIIDTNGQWDLEYYR